MKKILVIGSLNMDLVVQVEKMPLLGETMFGKGFMQIPGGKGANQGVAAARLGGNVAMVGKVGADGFGQELVAGLKQDGVDIRGISETDQVATGTALIMVDDLGNNSIVVVPGANFTLKPEDLKREPILSLMQEADILLMQLEVPMETVEAALEMGKGLGKYTILNPAPAARLNPSILKYIDLLIPNEVELGQLTGLETKDQGGILAGAKKLMDQGIQEIIVTLGDKGCLHLSDQGETWHEAYRVKAVDTTAAGDSFAAAVAVALSQDQSMAEAIAYAMKVGALTVMKQGAQSSLPYHADVLAFKEGSYEKR